MTELDEDDEAALDELFAEDVVAHDIPAAIDPYGLEVGASPVKIDKVALALEDENGNGEEEPPWLLIESLLEGEEPGPEAEDAEAKADYIDSLPEDSDRPVADLEDVCSQLVQYLIGHPSALVTKKRKFPSKGSKSRYFGEERSEDVMADKVVTGCWVCGKTSHESHECAFKRCFNCSEMGHEVAECARKSGRCQKCRSTGHEQEECPMLEYEAGIISVVSDACEDGEPVAELTDVFFCRCARCGEDGHLNCAPVPHAPILKPAVPVADPPPGYSGIGGHDPWSRPTPPLPPGKLLLRPRAPAQWQSYGSSAASRSIPAALGGPKPPAQPPPGIGKGKGKAGWMTPSTIPPRPSSAPHARHSNGVIPLLKRERDENSPDDWSSLWEDETEMHASVGPTSRWSGKIAKASPAIGARHGGRSWNGGGGSGDNGGWGHGSYNGGNGEGQWGNSGRSQKGGGWHSNGGGARWGSGGQGSWRKTSW